ncbi:MBL fold metallo-hydrolase [Alicyclobacillus sendaiensis]|uniref:MBL fold metallo-hydrolase n=1 Tax=Alicyclobacillus sendaiensis TaxID=192387 RepID=UPI0009F9EF43|nr:MBL fold metallo-hydrolase [Alicyclobacillus sendaiensis]
MMELTLTAWTPAEVYDRILRREPFFLLDVRNEDAFADWRIEGDAIEAMNVPYFDLLDGVDQLVPKLPKDKDILVVCAKEGSSKFVAEELVKAGLERVAYLQGGMRAWSEYLHPVKVGDVAGGALYQFLRVGKGCLSYAVVSNGEMAVVDPARFTDVYLHFAQEKGAKIVAVIDTHLHADHISGGRQLAEAAGATYYLPPGDAGEVTYAYEPLTDGKEIRIGQSRIVIRALHSPGHTPGSTSLIVDDKYLLSGDILFVGSIGRPDLAGRAKEFAPDLRRTLYETYRQLPGHLLVLPAHYAWASEVNDEGVVAATLSELYAKNPGLQIQDEGEFVTTVTENLPPQPNAYQQIRMVNMGKLAPTPDEASEMEIGPNRCAVHG